MSAPNYRDTFIFYRSFKEAIAELEDKDKLAIYEAITDYALDFLPPAFTTGYLKSIFNVIKPILDKNAERWRNGYKGKDSGAKGGAPIDNKNALKQPQNNPKTTPNKDNNKDNNKDKDNIVTKVNMFHGENVENSPIFSEFLNRIIEENIYIPDCMSDLTEKQYITLRESHSLETIVEAIANISNYERWHSYKTLYAAIKRYLNE